MTDSSGSGAEERLAELDRRAVAVLSGGRADLAVGPDLEELLGLDLRDHPWAELIVAAALVDLRDDRADPLLARSLRNFRSRQDRQGIGYATFVQGNAAVIRGELTEAARCYQLTREQLGPDCPVDAVVLAQTGLAAYDQGELNEAIAVTEEALALARLRTARRYEGQACLYLAFFSLIIGAFDRADTLLTAAEEVFRELTNPLERVELPTVLGARGVLHALRGQEDAAEQSFAEALEIADALQMPPVGAIPRLLRAEFMAEHHPTRSVSDARQGLEWLVASDVGWWRTWGLRAQGVAAREAGDLGTSVHLLERLLEQPLNPLERGVTLLALGETLVRTDRPTDAVPILEEAIGLLELRGARYWLVRCWMAMAEGGPRSTDARRRAVDLAENDAAYRHLLGERTKLRITMLGDAGVWREQERLHFATLRAELAVFALALAGDAGIHEDVLIDRLWPQAAADRARAQLRTLLWQVRRALGREAWRVSRRGHLLHFDLHGVSVDVLEARAKARAQLADIPAGPAAAEVAREMSTELSRPLLAGWQYEPWVEAEADTNAQLVNRLITRPGS